MKKALAILLAFVLVLGMTACVASDPTTAGKTEPTNKPTNGTMQPTTAPTAPTEPEANPKAIFTLDNEHFSFKVLSASNTEDGYLLNVSIENKSTSALSFMVNNASANDYVCTDVTMYCEVNGSETGTCELVLPRSVLDINSITEPTKVEFALYVENSATWDVLYNAPCTIYPKGEENHVDDGGYTAKEGDTVLIDNEHCTVIVTGYEPNNEMGYVVNLYVSNKSDKNLNVAAVGMTINDLVFDPYWSVDVAAGKRCFSQMIWWGDAFANYGVGDITKIDFDLSAKDNTDPESPEFAGVHCTLYPMGEEAYKPFERPTQETDIILMDNEYVTIIATSIGFDENGDYIMILFIQNKSDVNVVVKPTTVCLNGVEIDPWWNATVPAGKPTYGSISWFGSNLNSYDITTVETITMTMTISDENGETTFVTEDITINP